MHVGIVRSPVMGLKRERESPIMPYTMCRNCQKPGDGIETQQMSMSPYELDWVGIVRSPVMGLKQSFVMTCKLEVNCRNCQKPGDGIPMKIAHIEELKRIFMLLSEAEHHRA